MFADLWCHTSLYFMLHCYALNCCVVLCHVLLIHCYHILWSKVGTDR